MKKVLAILLTMMLAFSFVACNSGGGKDDGPAVEEVKGVTIPAFTVYVNGVEITHNEMAEYPVYSVQATSVNSAGTESTTTYVGFKLKDVLAAAGLTENYIWVEAMADDGYAVTLTGDIVMADSTLLAVTKDGSPFANGPWFAPCKDETTGNYLKNTVGILVNTTEGKPDAVNPDVSGGGGSGGEGLPEILDRTDKVEFAPFSFKVNGTEVTNETLEGLSIYKISANVVNSSGAESTVDYTGYKLADVLAACGVTDYTTVTIIANDGYELELDSDLIDSDYTLVAIEKDKETGEDGTIWVAPCSETDSKSYAKLVVEIVAE